MNHSEAVEQMTSERYLLNELTPEARDAFEEHLFDCPECALDLRSGALFVREAKVQLPELLASQSRSGKAKGSVKRSFWSALWRPAFAAPAFAALLIVVGYQNFITLPALRHSANEPRLAPLAPLHSATRGATLLTFTADRTHGVALPVDLVIDPEVAPAASYSFDLRDPKGKLVWTGGLPATTLGPDSDQSFSLTIPGGMLQSGPYSLMVTSVTAQGGLRRRAAGGVARAHCVSCSRRGRKTSRASPTIYERAGVKAEIAPFFSDLPQRIAQRASGHCAIGRFDGVGTRGHRPSGDSRAVAACARSGPGRERRFARPVAVRREVVRQRDFTPRFLSERLAELDRGAAVADRRAAGAKSAWRRRRGRAARRSRPARRG